MKPIKAYIGGCHRGYAAYPEDDTALTLDDAAKKVIICPDPGLTEDEKEELKIRVLTGSTIRPALFDSAILKLAIMVGMIEFKEAK